MKIRNVKKEDYNDVYELVKTAFLTAQVTDGNEQNFVNELRQRDTYIPELEFVLEKDDELIGHIMLSKQAYTINEKTQYGLLIAPLCIKKEYRDKQYGSKLMKFALEEALKQQYTALFLVGNPEYYRRFGFKSVTEYGLENASEIPDQYVLALEMVPNTLHEGSITIE